MDKKFVRRGEWLTRIGFGFRPATEWRGEGEARAEVQLPLFQSIFIGLTSHEWCGLMMNEGKFYIGGCCANSSSIQDDMENVFRMHSGWIDASNLIEMAQHLKDHHGSGMEKPVKDVGRLVAKTFKMLKDNEKKRNTGKYMADPWELIELAALIVEPYHAPEKVIEAPSKMGVVDAAYRNLALGLKFLSHHDIVEALGSDTRKELTAEWPSQVPLNRKLLIAKILPDLKRVNEEMTKLEPFLFEGVALVTKDDPDELTSNGGGICVFESEDEAKKLIEYWSKEEVLYEDKKNVRRRPSEFFRIRPIIVTSGGLQFKDDLHEEISN